MWDGDAEAAQPPIHLAGCGTNEALEEFANLIHFKRQVNEIQPHRLKGAVVHLRRSRVRDRMANDADNLCGVCQAVNAIEVTQLVASHLAGCALVATPQ